MILAEPRSKDLLRTPKISTSNTLTVGALALFFFPVHHVQLQYHVRGSVQKICFSAWTFYKDFSSSTFTQKICHSGNRDVSVLNQPLSNIYLKKKRYISMDILSKKVHIVKCFCLLVCFLTNVDFSLQWSQPKYKKECSQSEDFHRKYFHIIVSKGLWLIDFSFSRALHLSVRLHLQKQQQIIGRQNQSDAGFGIPGRTDKHPPPPVI